MTDPSNGPRKDARTRALIETIRTTTSAVEQAQALDEVVALHLPLTRALAHRYSNRGLDRDDLEQVAALALLKAVQRFDLSHETEFGAYATPTITGELRRHFRDHGWLVRPPRSLQERRQTVTDARIRLEQSLSREPEVGEVASELGLTADEVREALVAASNLRPASLDVSTADGRRPVLDLLDRDATVDDPALDDSLLVRAAVRRLAPRDRRIVELRFTHDLTQAEIATTLGCSAMQVSRVLRRVLAELQEDLEPALALSA